MIRGLNKVMIIGNVGRDPEMRYLPSGKPVTSFGVTVTHDWTGSAGERRERTEWFNVVVWGDMAENCKQGLASGRQVYVEGRLQTRDWDDGEGKRHCRTELVASEMIILDKQPAPDLEAAGESRRNGDVL